jgi:hypothetical protein
MINSALFSAFGSDPLSGGQQQDDRQVRLPRLFRPVSVRESDVIADSLSEFSVASSSVYAPEASTVCDDAYKRTLHDLRTLGVHAAPLPGDLPLDHPMHSRARDGFEHPSASDLAAISAPLCVPAAKRPENSRPR